MAYYRKLHPLRLFFQIWGAYVPLVLMIVIITNYRYRSDNWWIEELLPGVVFLLTVTGIPLYWHWRYKLPYELAQCIPASLRPGLSRWGSDYFLTLLTAVVASPILIVSLAIRDGTLIALGYFILCALAYAYSYLHTAFLTARLLRMAELKRTVTFADHWGAFLLVFGGAWTSPWLAVRTRRLVEEIDDPYVPST